MSKIEYIIGQEDRKSSWAKFHVHGLEKYCVPSNDYTEASTKTNWFKRYVCSNVPTGTIFTIYDKSGNRFGTTGFIFAICEVCDDATFLESTDTQSRYCEGNFKILVKGEGKIKAPRLYDWWIKYVGEGGIHSLSSAHLKVFALHCAEYINKRGIKELPAMQGALINE